jgi:DNA-binding IclR family transcriptional regulator
MKSTTLHKAVRILRKISDDAVLSPIREISAELRIPRSTVHRICQALSEERILDFDERTKQYRWGSELIHIAGSVYQTNEIRRRAIPILQQIVSQLNETTQLVMYDSIKRQIIFTDEVACDHTIRYHTPIGIPLPIYVGASGKSVMAFLPEKEVEGIIASGLPPIKNRVPISPNRLKKDLKSIRMRGFAITFEERTPGAMGVGCPVFNSNADVIGGVVLTMPVYRFQSKFENRIVKLVREGGEQLSRMMGLPPNVSYPPDRKVKADS